MRVKRNRTGVTRLARYANGSWVLWLGPLYIERFKRVTSPSASTKSEAPGPRPVERLVEAAFDALKSSGTAVGMANGDDYSFGFAAFSALEATMDPALGDQRLVVAADQAARTRVETIAEVVEWTREQFWFPATPGGVAAAIERKFKESAS